ncbi:MAG: hypothetical protein SGJ01_14825 [Gemmatimonadota bacterium]|nr:hypothetical protein [Gemmatimonadota bacterium]
MQPRLLPAVVSALLLACAPASSMTSATPDRTEYVVRVTSGETEGVAVDWALVPEDAWPVEGRRNDTPFLIELPHSRVALMIRPKQEDRLIEVTLLRREHDGTVKRLETIGPVPLAVVAVRRGGGAPEILVPADPVGPAGVEP